MFNGEEGQLLAHHVDGRAPGASGEKDDRVRLAVRTGGRDHDHPYGDLRTRAGDSVLRDHQGPAAGSHVIDGAGVGAERTARRGCPATWGHN